MVSYFYDIHQKSDIYHIIDFGIKIIEFFNFFVIVAKTYFYLI